MNFSKFQGKNRGENLLCNDFWLKNKKRFTQYKNVLTIIGDLDFRLIYRKLSLQNCLLAIIIYLLAIKRFLYQESKILIFATDFGLKFLAFSKNCLNDETFKTTLPPFLPNLHHIWVIERMENSSCLGLT